MEADLIATRFEMNELYSKISSSLPSSKSEESGESAKVSRRIAMRLLVGDMDAPNNAPGMTDPTRTRPPSTAGRRVPASPKGPASGVPQKKPAAGQKKKVTRKVPAGAALNMAPSGDPMEEFFAIMEQFVDEPEELECVRIAESSRKNGGGKKFGRPDQMKAGTSFEGFHADIERSKNAGQFESQTHSGPMPLVPASSTKPVQKPQLPRVGSRDFSKPHGHPMHERTHSVGGLKDLHSMWNSPASSQPKSSMIQRVGSINGGEMQSLVDALKAEIKAKDKLLEASEKERQMTQEELSSTWHHADDLQHQLNDSQALVASLQRENEVLRTSAKRGATGMQNSELAGRILACEEELKRTRSALQQVEQERDSLAEEMEAALSSWAADTPSPCSSCTTPRGFPSSSSTSSSTCSASASHEVERLMRTLDTVQRELRAVRGERDALMAAVRQPSGRQTVGSAGVNRYLRKASSASALTYAQQQQLSGSLTQHAQMISRQPMEPKSRQVHFAQPVTSSVPIACSVP